MNKRGKVTPSNPSPKSFMQQSERKSSRNRSPRGRSPSGRTSRWPCKDYLRGTHFVKNGTLQNACSTRPRAKSAHSHIVRLMNSRRKGMKRMMARTTWSDSKDRKYPNCNSTSSLIHHHFDVENKIQDTSHHLF